MLTDYADVGDIVVSGCIGPRGDGYRPGAVMTAAEAAAYHRPQIEALADAGADVVTAMTISYAEEAVGIVLASRAAAIPVVISFTVETDGRLPTGQSLDEAIAEVDAATDGYAAYVMINCAHPAHFAEALDPDSPVIARVRGVRANASVRSHAELDEAQELDDGDPGDLARRYVALADRLPNLTVMGGCCGTDTRHVDAIAAACAPLIR